ncbi:MULTISPECIES: hypothetical protein [Pseudoalteromonas]|uniref:hypothetical protein n=1 Tax=Pseudoalteromonas TaxID=53246 RepID=UPI001602CAB2|nr:MULTISPECIES: hypothetical protein [Pseudoalteromonas]MBB1310300.1 hypothetical protein [Pseudoalteromonas sp. SR41-8]MBB1397804.1 hypothetical protein [Pseudoalteromonas sp. SG44-8]MBB1410174.1 hypothetical protein [Pseudoalteromonas sp. SG44-17]
MTTSQPHVGLSLVNKAPLGLIVTAVIAGIATVMFELELLTLAYSVLGGLVCAIILIAYWLGKGGLFFIVGVSIPLLMVIVVPLTSMAALLYLISGFFFGFCLALLGYKLLAKSDN